MSENNLIYEITKMMNDKPAIQNDMNEAMKLVQKMFEEKYIAKINNTINTHLERTRQNPSREINLLHAFKAFLPESEHEKVEKLIDTLFMMDTLSSIKSEYSAMAKNPLPPPKTDAPKTVSAAGPAEDKSVHPDGIYDIDNQCMTTRDSKNSIFMPVFLLMSMKML